ncbi:DUF2807 domain-containing protein [Allorhizobium sp. BGMRC 0089]|uniref:head GIN domain-containing protein n=1 Tax=Allorhizobium sonneratiae TaxID=2934936 RepID=UPI002034A6AA|nr:head GIN domain-containing protein [Allorhizobium sonneratiae]MCM2292821.1 DUF2807 domain-containing protein [Allorhizobium sonneratiae]
MTRKLTFIAASGLIISAVFLTVGFGLADQNQPSSLLWGSLKSTCQPINSGKTQIILPFTATDKLTIALPASIRYAVGDTAQVAVSGNPALIDHVQIEGSELKLDCHPGWVSSSLNITVTAPPITRWTLLGSEKLALPQLEQPHLVLNIRGSGSVTASGHVHDVDLDVSGSGTARLKDLTAQTAQVDIRGSGDVYITAKKDADVSISGSGDVKLFGNPVLRRSEIRGSGHIQQMP